MTSEAVKEVYRTFDPIVFHIGALQTKICGSDLFAGVVCVCDSGFSGLFLSSSKSSSNTQRLFNVSGCLNMILCLCVCVIMALCLLSPKHINRSLSITFSIQPLVFININNIYIYNM